jgi:hypothetical protein
MISRTHLCTRTSTPTPPNVRRVDATVVATPIAAVVGGCPRQPLVLVQLALPGGEPRPHEPDQVVNAGHQ